MNIKEIESHSFLVGGAVRDIALDKQPKDLDYVVVGLDVADMLSAGFEQCGKGFPVFLHPDTKDEYALARSEVSTGTGKNDFLVNADNSTTLEQDVKRRDLSINSLAMDSDGNIIDFVNGLQDLNNKLLRHTSSAFIEDPVRVLRIARFASRFPEFEIADETMLLMQDMVSTGLFNIQDLTSERVQLELQKVLSEDKPSVFFRVLNECGALEIAFPHIFNLIGKTQPSEYHPEGDSFEHTMLVLDESCKLSSDLMVRYGALVHDLGKGITDIDKLPRHHGHEKAGIAVVKQMGLELKGTPSKWTEFGMMVSGSHLLFHRLEELRFGRIVKWFNNDGAFRNPERFEKLKTH